MLPKNMMDQLGQHLKFKHNKSALAGAGTQTAALGFGGDASRCYSSNGRI
jgi:hypothetical protein